MMDSVIKLASFTEIKLMLAWAAAEGWNPGLLDAEAFQIIDPCGFFIEYLADEPIACLANVKYGAEFSFAGLYIVKPDYRGAGYGYRLVEFAHQQNTAANVGTDAVVEQQENYKKLGFKFAHRNFRYYFKNSSFKNFTHPSLKSALELPLSLILNYDHHFFPCHRDAFLMTWLLAANAKSWIYYDQEQVKGYGVIRKCQQGYKIGPLFADSRLIATQIFKKLCAEAELGASIYLDIPEVNTEAQQLVCEYGMEYVFETARMYMTAVPEISMNRTFGITCFEVG